MCVFTNHKNIVATRAYCDCNHLQQTCGEGGGAVAAPRWWRSPPLRFARRWTTARHPRPSRGPTTSRSGSRLRRRRCACEGTRVRGLRSPAYSGNPVEIGHNTNALAHDCARPVPPLRCAPPGLSRRRCRLAMAIWRRMCGWTRSVWVSRGAWLRPVLAQRALRPHKHRSQ